MNARHLILLSLSALVMTGAGTARTATPSTDPHGHAQQERAAMGVQHDPMAPVYIVTSRATFDAGVRHLATDARATRDSVGRDLVVSRIRAHQLDDVSRMVHERERRCGGYFAFASREKALGFLRSDRTGTAMRKAAISYTIDNQKTVSAWLPQVRESRIRDTILHLSTQWPNRYYTNTSGQQASQWIKSTWATLGAGRTDVTTEYISCIDCGKQSSVVLTVRGTSKPNEVVVVGAHMDSISDAFVGGVMQAPGADDDASGIAVLTETIRIALAQGWRPHRTVKFMAYSAEEVGLRGSQAIATKFRNANTNVVGVLQIDMTTYTAGSTVSMRLVEDFSNAGLQQFVRNLFDTYLAPLGLTRGPFICGYACSDHASWTAAGYPSAFMVEPTLFPHRHTQHDTLANAGPTAASSVNFAKLALAFVGELGKTNVAAPQDFNKDGRSDLFWRNTATGANDIWFSADSSTRQAALAVPALSWQVVGIADFTGDGNADVLWRNSASGANDLWPSANASLRRALAPLADTGWRVAGVGDFGNNGIADIFWRHAGTGQDMVWVDGNAAQTLSRPTVGLDWQVVGVGDFDGDLFDDVLWRNRVSGANELWRRGTNASRLVLVTVSNTAWKVAGVGDFNGDGRDDILWRQDGTGANVVWFSANASTQQGLGTVATAWRVANVADYTGDGRSDILWRHSTLGNNEMWPGANSAQRVVLSPVSNMDWQVMR